MHIHNQRGSYDKARRCVDLIKERDNLMWERIGTTCLRNPDERAEDSWLIGAQDLIVIVHQPFTTSLSDPSSKLDVSSFAICQMSFLRAHASFSHIRPWVDSTSRSNVQFSSSGNQLDFCRNRFPPCRRSQRIQAGKAEGRQDSENAHSTLSSCAGVKNDFLCIPVGSLDKTTSEAVDHICMLNQQPPSEQKRRGSDLPTLLRRFWKVAAPYWSSEDKTQARLRLAGVFALTLGTTGISVGFNFLGRDFYNALASKDQEQFTLQLLYYLGAFIGGIPVFVLRDYGRDTLALRWRAWMTSYYLNRYFEGQTFYRIQSQALIDNPDQRVVDDLNSFTGTALSFALALFNATIDLISFSGILFGIYPPLFVVLIVYSLGGTAISVVLGKSLVNLNFLQEKKEADFRYGLVRVRENAESIAFYKGEKNEMQLLLQRFKQSFENFSELLLATRNLEFFTSGYRYLIQILPAAVVAPMYFSGKIEFGVINQSYSAFNHVLSDFSLIVYQFQALSAFSAVIDRLGEFSDVLDQQNFFTTSKTANEGLSSTEEKSTDESLITIIDVHEPILEDTCNRPHHGQLLLAIEHLTVQTPQYTMTLVNDLSLAVQQQENLLIIGSSGSGKTSLLRAIAGLWRSGTGTIKRYLQYENAEPNVPNSSDVTMGELHNTAKVEKPGLSNMHDEAGVEPQRPYRKRLDSNLDKGGIIFFLPQRPYMILGTLRQQLLYPTWIEHIENNVQSVNHAATLPSSSQPDQQLQSFKSIPTDEELTQVLKVVHLEHLMARCGGLNSNVEWASVLSLGEQQRLAFARLLLSRPKLALLDESTSALDEGNEAHLYSELKHAAITYISVGHRSSLRQYHAHVLTLLEPERERVGRNWIVDSTGL